MASPANFANYSYYSQPEGHSQYSPMIVGHQKQWQFLRKSAQLGKVPHALLFSGQPQLGKRRIALEFIKLLNCQNPDESKKPCQVCRSCQDIEKGIHPDLSIVEPEGPPSFLASTGKREIKISQIRELSWRISLRAYSAPFKTVIIDEAHCLTQEAQSCFLKTLEEPKGETLFILITPAPEMLLPTILSRCEIIKFYPVPLNEIERYLSNQGVSQKMVQEIAKLSFGRPGRAIEFLKNPDKIEEQKKRIKEVQQLTRRELAFRFQYAKMISQEPQDLKEVLEIWLRYFREIFIKKTKPSEYSGHFPIPPHYSLAKLKNILQLIQTTNFLISTTNVNPRLALEILMLEL